jgi:hypothetical protein
MTDLYDRDIREVVPERLVLEATTLELHEARFADTAQRDRIIPPGTPRIQWEKVYSPDGRPTVGGEYQGGFDGRGEILVGRIVEVGAHWSDPEKGRSGWHAVVEYPYVPARTRRE